MQLRAPFLSSVFLVAFSILAGSDILAHAYHGHHNHPHPVRTGTSVFPFLTWLRDSAVQFVFGGSTAKNTCALPKPVQNYHNEVVLRFNVTAVEEEKALKQAADRLFLDIWAFTTEFVDIRIQKDYISSLLGLLPASLSTSHWILISDLSSAVYATYPPQPARQTQVERNVVDLSGLRNSADGIEHIFFKDYQPMPVVVKWMRLIEAMFPSFVQYVNIGTSYEGREISALRVGEVIDSQPSERKKPRKTIVVTGGLHAREWISTTTVNYLAWSFITSYGKETMITKLLQTFDIVFIPALNPDGIEYTWQSDRLWRKSRQHTNLRFCRGLDLDHAFGYEWDGTKHQTDPCSESYGGDQPFQAVEAVELATWAKNQTENNNVNFVGLIDLHSYSQQVMFPFSYSCEVDPPNLENLMELATGIAKAIRLSSGESYSVTSACEGAVMHSLDDRAGVRLEAGGGSAIDWFYHELKAHFSYQIKLRDIGSYGFLLPRDEIVPVGEEIFNAMKYFGDFLLGNNGIEKSTSQPEQKPLEEVEGTAWEDSEDIMELRRRRRRI